MLPSLLFLNLHGPYRQSCFDCMPSGTRLHAITVYLVVWMALLIFSISRSSGCSLPYCALQLFFFGGSSLAPSNNGQWQADVPRTAYAEVHGSRITFYNVRSCDYRSEFDYTCQWLTRQVDLDVSGAWTSSWITGARPGSRIHPEFRSPSRSIRDRMRRRSHLAFSIETRKQVGQHYSAIRGFFRQFTLISIISDERDLVRLRATIAMTRISTFITSRHRRPLPVPCYSTMWPSRINSTIARSGTTPSRVTAPPRYLPSRL